MHSHSDADAYMQIAHTRVARKFWDAYLCTALYFVMYCSTQFANKLRNAT